MKFKKAEEIKAFLLPIANEQGIEICDVEFKNGSDPAITIFIDKPCGVDLVACERFHRAIDGPIDELDPTFGEAYTLNVSSLGADRPFKTDKDFTDNLGGDVEVKLNASVKGKKFYEGALTYFDDKIIRVKINEKETLTFDRKSVVKINKAIKF